MSITKATVLDLATRNDGYLVRAGDPDIVALKEAGLVVTRPAGDGWWIAMRIIDPSRPWRGFRSSIPAQRAAEIGVTAP